MFRTENVENRIDILNLLLVKHLNKNKMSKLSCFNLCLLEYRIRVKFAIVHGLSWFEAFVELDDRFG